MGDRWVSKRLRVIALIVVCVVVFVISMTASDLVIMPAVDWLTLHVFGAIPWRR